MTAACDCCDTATFTEEPALGACDCPDEELAADPFTALRVTFGMLLGEDDFRVLMGHPRGKQQLHGAWEHGAGVLFGMGLSYEPADDQVVVAKGLARDGRGRELRLESRSCVTLTDWAREYGKDGKAAGWVVARYRNCLERPVPAIANPCDVTRRHDDYSRVVESICIEIVEKRPPPWRPYPRVRTLLLGPDEDEHPAADVLDAAEKARAAVVCEPAEQRAQVLLAQVRALAAADVADLGPERVDGQDAWPLPRVEENSGVVLGRIAVELDGQAVRPGSLDLDPTVRTALLPSSTVAELLCGFAPGVLGVATQPDAGGPRLRRDTVHWSRGNTCLEFCVTAPLARGSAERGVEISSLSEEDGWATASIDAIRVVDGGTRVIVDLDQAPAYPTVRVIIRGTGPNPLYGRDPAVPFAGDEGGPPGTTDDGHDAVITARPAKYEGEKR